METVKMVEVTRNGAVESVHQGAAVLINSSGEILKEWGKSDILIYPRSADLIPDFKEADTDKIINKLNLTISNKLF